MYVHLRRDVNVPRISCYVMLNYVSRGTFLKNTVFCLWFAKFQRVFRDFGVFTPMLLKTAHRNWLQIRAA